MREAVTATVVWVKVAELDIGSYHRWGWCVSPKIVEISRILKGRNRPAVTDFSYSETDRGFGRGCSSRHSSAGCVSFVGGRCAYGLMVPRMAMRILVLLTSCQPSVVLIRVLVPSDQPEVRAIPSNPSLRVGVDAGRFVPRGF